jgi:low temperature requirement protein LtrA
MVVRIARPARRRARERWFVPPRLLTAHEEGERHATWLELFFDLVFVVAITQLSHELVVHHSAAGFLRFAGLFVPVYVAWQGYMAYATRFDTDDLAFRVAYFAAMLAVAAMAVLIDDVARGVNSAGFAVAYVVLRSIMLALYWRAWRAVPDARPLIRFYGIGYVAGAAVWLASLAVDTPVRYVVWGVALTLELSLPPLSTQLHRRIPTSARHLPERWALFTLIVLGESVVAVAVGVSGASWGLSSASAAVLGFAAVAAIWWLYFDRQADVVLRGSTMSVVVYSYAHIPLLMGLAATSAGLRLLIERARQDHLGTGAAVALLGGVVLYLAALIATRTASLGASLWRGIALKLAASALVLGLLGVETVLPPVALAGGLAFVLAAMIFVERTVIAPASASLNAEGAVPKNPS